MYINYDKSRLKSALEDFYCATGITLQLLDENFKPIFTDIERNEYCMAIQHTKDGIKACRCSDETILKRCKESLKPEIHICHAGLSDIAVPVLFDKNIAGYIIMGQMRNNESFESIKAKIKKFSIDIEKMKEYYEATPVFDKKRIESISRLAVMLAKYILTEDMLKPNFNRTADAATKFIINNLSEPLKADLIAKNINVSKSTLYKCFNDCFNCTVNEYITQKRIEKASQLLVTTDLSMEEISQLSGFSSAAYFTKNFKKFKGTSPLKYKRKHSSDY